MGEKINSLIEILKFFVEVDIGISNQHREWILQALTELEEE